MAESEGKMRCATLLHSLPKLTIPKNNRPEPEQITPSRIVNFLEDCKKHGRAYTFRLFRLGHPPHRGYPADIDANAEPAAAVSVQSLIGSREDVLPAPAMDLDESNDGMDDDIPTLDFDRRDWKESDCKNRELEDVKVEHEHWISLLKDDPRNPEIIKKCRHWRRVREEIGEVIKLISERQRIRREFREEFNPKWVE